MNSSVDPDQGVSATVRIPTTDLLLALFDAVSLKHCNEPDNEGPNIHLGNSCNILRELSQRTEFSDALRHLDFTRIGDSWISHALENFFFQAGAWGVYKVPNPALNTITIPLEQAKKRLREVKTEFGPVGQSIVDRMATAFVEIQHASKP